MQILYTMMVAVLALAVAIVVSWGFRRVAIFATSGRIRSAMKDAPLTACFGMLVILGYLAVTLFAPLIAPFSEREVVGAQFLKWDDIHLLGTDYLGRDMLSRMIYGARNTVSIALFATLIAFFVGAFLGLLAASVGGWRDTMLSQVVDLFMAIPALILSLLLLTIFGTSIVTLILVIAAIDSTRVYRLARSVAQSVVEMDYIEAARLRGEGTLRLIMREVLPNTVAPLVAEFGLRFCFVFLAISALSFLGVGIQPPAADWGSMVRENATLITFGDVTPLLPAGAIALLTVAVNFVVDWQLHRASGLKD